MGRWDLLHVQVQSQEKPETKTPRSKQTRTGNDIAEAARACILVGGDAAATALVPFANLTPPHASSVAFTASFSASRETTSVDHTVSPIQIVDGKISRSDAIKIMN